MSDLDLLWVSLCALLVFVMQAGFLCLESGLTRSKNAINVAAKNLLDFVSVSLAYWLIGFGLMFGPSVGGWIGWGSWAANPQSDADATVFLIFQLMFCATAVTVVSGAVAERMRFVVYLWLSVWVGLLVYPIFGHWVWSSGSDSSASGWLSRLGFIDFAGSTVVHSLGGWIALAGVLRLGARAGRFDSHGVVRHIPGSNLPLALLGVLFLFFGWFGFNGGSLLQWSAAVPSVLLNTALGGVGGTVVAVAMSAWLHGGRIQLPHALNGVIAGLVAVTAGAHAFTALESLLVGGIGAVAMLACSFMLLRLRIDDAVDAISAHLAAGIWGTLAVGLLGETSILATGLSQAQQIGVQALGVIVCGIWAFASAWLFFGFIQRFMPLRVSLEDERRGLNIAEHGARTDQLELLEAMESQRRSGDLTQRVHEEPDTEIGQIAASYNRVIAALDQATVQTRTLLRDMREGVLSFDALGNLLQLNPAAERLLGVHATEVVGQPIDVLIKPHQILREEQRIHLFTPGHRFELRLNKQHGRRVIEWSMSAAANSSSSMIAVLRDITERHELEHQLARERDLAQTTLASIGDGVITTDEAGNIQYLNAMAERLTGWRNVSAREQRITAVYRLEDESGELQAGPHPVRQALASGDLVQRLEPLWLRRPDGDRVPVIDSVSPIRSREGFLIGAVLVFRDMTQTLSLARELSHQAKHDTLTGLPNRRSFEDSLKLILSSPHTAAHPDVLCYLDLDQFKVVNDTCGHVAGDELLRQVATLFKGHLRESDLLARLGGDEFGLILRACPIEQALRVVNGLRQSIEDFRFSWQDRSFAIGVSIGLVEISETERDMNRLLSSADAACYAAKDAGRNRVHLFQPDDQALLERQGHMQWVSRLQQALDEDRLRLFVQPIVGLQNATKSVQHQEILLRLEEEGRLIGPGAFLPAAERYNMASRIDHWVMTNVLSWLRGHARAGTLHGLHAVNLSGNSLSDERFLDRLSDLLSEHAGLAPHLCLEITETAAVANMARLVPRLKQWRALGCTIALDDFGSGLSSFAYLKTLPVDYLKIDGSFVRDITEDPIDRAMVQAIHTIGQQMGLQTIAEFVESEAIAQALTEIGVDFGQGYFFAQPAPLDAQTLVR